MFREKDFAVVAQLLAEELFHPDFFFDPNRNGLEERAQPNGRVSKVGVQYSVKLDERLLIKRDEVRFVDANASLAQTIFDREFGKRGVMLFAGESFFLGGGHEVAVAHQTGGAVVIKG